MTGEVVFPSSFPANVNIDKKAYLAPGVKVSIHLAHADNSRVPRTQLSFRDEKNQNSYTRTFEGKCELGEKGELILTNATGKRIGLKDVFPGISSWILRESPVSTESTATSDKIQQITQTPLVQSA